MGSEGESSVQNWQKQMLFTEKMKVFLRRNPIITKTSNPITTMTRNPITAMTTTIGEEPSTEAAIRPNSEQGTGSSSQPANILPELLFPEQIKAFMKDLRTAEDN